MSFPLTRAQAFAIDTVRRHAAAEVGRARETIRALLHRHGVLESRYDLAVAAVQRGGRIALHFHPERLDQHGRSVAEGLLESGVVCL
jgi:nuclear transport factor 2 (NTF2) superfamily protein